MLTIGLILLVIGLTGSMIALKKSKVVVEGESVVYCHSCGTKNHASSKFCSNCGTPLSASEIKPVVEPTKPEVYDFRHIKDVKNIVPYSTLNEPLNHIFYSYIHQAFPDCRIETKVAASTLFPGAPEYAMPINFLITKGEKKVAVLLVSRSKVKRYSFMETNHLCQENNFPLLRFCLEYDNEEDYVVERIAKALE